MVSDYPEMIFQIISVVKSPISGYQTHLKCHFRSFHMLCVLFHGMSLPRNNILDHFSSYKSNFSVVNTPKVSFHEISHGICIISWYLIIHEWYFRSFQWLRELFQGIKYSQSGISGHFTCYVYYFMVSDYPWMLFQVISVVSRTILWYQKHLKCHFRSFYMLRVLFHGMWLPRNDISDHFSSYEFNFRVVNTPKVAFQVISHVMFIISW